MERPSDSDVLLKELRLKFGEKVYVVPVLRMAASAKWREYYMSKTRESKSAIPSTFDEKSPEVIKEVSAAFLDHLFKFSDIIPDVVFAYAPSLPKEEIMASDPYDQEFLIAFKKVWSVAYSPFLASLGMAMEQEKRLPSDLASSVILN